MTQKESARHVLLFTAGGLRLGVFIAEVGKLLIEDQLAPVPFSHPALAGLLLQDEQQGAVPVFDLLGIVDVTRLPPRHARGATVALFPTERGPIGLRLDALHGTVEDYLPIANPEESARLFAGLSDGARRSVAGVAAVGGVPFFFFAPEALLVELGLHAPGKLVASEHKARVVS